MQDLMSLLNDQSKVIGSLQRTIEGLNDTIKSLNNKIEKLEAPRVVVKDVVKDVCESACESACGSINNDVFKSISKCTEKVVIKEVPLNSENMSNYKHAIQLFKLFNSTNMSEDWVSLNFHQNFNTRNTKLQIYNVSNYKVGQNLLVNRFKSLSNKIDYLWLNESLNSFKIKCKNIFLH